MAPLAQGLTRGADGVVRCAWSGSDPLYLRYHDQEWGFPVADDRRLFEKICLEGFQSGLSWLTILRKRENFRAAFRAFDRDRVARFGARDVARLLKDAGIVRHRGKIESTINNARSAPATWPASTAPSRASSGRSSPPQPTARKRLTWPVAHDDAQDPRLDRPQQGPQEARLDLRRPDHRLRLHAGDGPRQRPHRRLRHPQQSPRARATFRKPH